MTKGTEGGQMLRFLLEKYELLNVIISARKIEGVMHLVHTHPQPPAYPLGHVLEDVLENDSHVDFGGEMQIILIIHQPFE